MTISTRWYDDSHRVIILKFESNWTWEEFKQAQDIQAELARTVSNKVIALLEMHQTNSLPKGNVLVLGRSTFNNVPENVNLIILVIQSRLIEVFADLIVKMMPTWRSRIRFVKTAAEAQQVIDETLATTST
jgi:hypothetical protein